MNSADSGERYPGTTTRSVARVVLTLYGISLAMIALWPVPVDQGAAGFLRRVGRVLPMLTYPRIEFSANILLFVPLGVLLMLILRRRYLILPIAIAVTVAIECSQGLLLDKRTPSVLDIIANTAGACLGMLIVAAAESWRGSRPAGADAGRYARGRRCRHVGGAGHRAAGCRAETGTAAASGVCACAACSRPRRRSPRCRRGSRPCRRRLRRWIRRGSGRGSSGRRAPSRRTRAAGR